MEYCKFCAGSKGDWMWVSFPRPHDRWMKCGKCDGTGSQSVVERLYKQQKGG